MLDSHIQNAIGGSYQRPTKQQPNLQGETVVANRKVKPRWLNGENKDVYTNYLENAFLTLEERNKLSRTSVPNLLSAYSLFTPLRTT